MSENRTNSSVASQIHKDVLTQDCTHIGLVGGMLISLGGIVITGLKKAHTIHGIFSVSFVGLTMMHFFLHHRSISRKIKRVFHTDT